MSGIYGFTYESTAFDEARNILRTMAVSAAHGRSAKNGEYFDPSFSLGHTRFEVGGRQILRQPFVREESPWVIACDGEIYNYNSLVKLLGISHFEEKLETVSLIGLLVERFGWEFCDYIEGKFAIVLYNTKDHQLRLYSDSSGLKRIYYYHKSKLLVFSSVLDALLKHPLVDRGVDEDSILISSHLGYLPGDKTLLKGIRKLTCGESVLFRSHRGELELVSKRASLAAPLEASTLRGAIRESVREHIPRDVSQGVGLNLSGRLGSSILLYELREQGLRPNTYTARFENGDDAFERSAESAKRISLFFGTEHREVLITQESYADKLTKAFESLGEPSNDGDTPIHYLLNEFEVTRGSGERTVFTGDGLETLGGESIEMRSPSRYDRIVALLPRFITNTFFTLKTGRHLDFSERREWWLYHNAYWMPYLLATPKIEILVAAVRSNFERYTEKVGVGTVERNSRFTSLLLDRGLSFPCSRGLRCDMVCRSQGLDARTPFAYEPLRRFIDQYFLATHWKKSGGKNEWLWEQYRRVLHEEVHNLPSAKFSPPISWYGPKLRKLFLEILLSTSTMKRYVDWSKVRSMLESSGNKWPGRHIFYYLSLAVLAKRYRIEV